MKRRIISQHVKGVWNNIGLWFDFWQPKKWAGGQNQKSQKFILNIIPSKTRFVPIHSDDSLTAGSYRVDYSLQENLLNLVPLFYQHPFPNSSLFARVTSHLNKSK